MMKPGNSTIPLVPRKSVLVPGVTATFRNPLTFSESSDVPVAVKQRNSSRLIGISGNEAWLTVTVPVEIGFWQFDVVETKAVLMPLKKPPIASVAVSEVDSEFSTPSGLNTAADEVA